MDKENLNPVQVNIVAKELTIKAIESGFLPKGRNGSESAKIVLDFYHQLTKELNGQEN